VVLDICARASTVRGWTDDGVAILTTAVAVIGAEVGVERIGSIVDAAETDGSPQAAASNTETTIRQSILDRYSACVAEKQCHSGNEGEEHVGREVHLSV
jgi:hypothetical protein